MGIWSKPDHALCSGRSKRRDPPCQALIFRPKLRYTCVGQRCQDTLFAKIIFQVGSPLPQDLDNNNHNNNNNNNNNNYIIIIIIIIINNFISVSINITVTH